MNIILRGGPHDGEIEKRVERNVFAIGRVEHVMQRDTGKTKYCVEHKYSSTSDYERDLTRPRAKFRVFRFEATDVIDPPKK